jgi:DNA-directed RNA polymerase subunit alpha
VVEDVTEIVLNLKRCCSGLTRGPANAVAFRHKGLCGDIQLNQNVELVNPGQHICTLDKKKKFEMSRSEGGRFRPETRTRSRISRLAVAIDSLFSPVTRVTRETRVGQRTDYDRLSWRPDGWADFPDDA